ncbi:hypothetical protein [Pseudocolwellia sp. HL-MZ7]|uniref:hypothetical protein n=1 Tax=Pseudocolwellia sp. HL-MZ7 TaxID=3400627 RepID=UPI003CEDC9E3
MMNNISASQTDLINSLAQLNQNTTHTLSDELKNIEPEMVQALNELQLKNQSLGDEELDQLLQQQITSISTLSDTTSNATLNNVQAFDYKSSTEELAIRKVLTSQQEGLLNNESSDKLMERLNYSVKNVHQAYANTSDILSDIGQLGHEQKSFLATSQQRVDHVVDGYKNGIINLNNSDNKNYVFELSVKTKEGDVINITFNSSQGYDENVDQSANALNVSYQVEGELSEAEHKALTEIMSGVGAMADEFFKVSENSFDPLGGANQADMSLGFLSGINHQQLSDFDLTLSTNSGNNSSPRSIDLSYQFDQVAHQQNFDFESKNGSKVVDFSVSMSAYGGSDVTQMQQYLAALDSNLEDSRNNSTVDGKSSAFGKTDDTNMREGFALFKEAFSSMSSAAERYSQIESSAANQFLNSRNMVADLVDNIITNDSRYQGLKTDANSEANTAEKNEVSSDVRNTLGAGISKLADFDSTFSFAVVGEKINPKTTIDLSQVTEEHQSGKLHKVNQSKSVNTHFDYQLSRPDYYDKSENYQIGAVIQSEELVGLDQKHEVNIDQKLYREGKNPGQYELMMERTENQMSESKIRLIDEIWLETNENSHDMDKRERVEDEGEPEDFKVTNHHSHDKLITLIGDLDKLENNEKLKREYNVELSKVNFFMDK